MISCCCAATGSIWRAEFSRSRYDAGFESPVQATTGTGDSRRIELAVGDFDADWWGDLAGIRTGTDGNADVHIADVTGDGLPDLINAYRFTSRVRLQVAAALPDRGGFSLTAWGYSGRCTGCVSDLTPWAHTRLAGGDVDGDGVDDLLTLRAGAGGEIGAMWTRISTGSGFADPEPTWADPTTCFGVDGDVNGDGYRDAVLPHSSYDVAGLADAGAIWFVDGATGQASIVHQDTAGIIGAAEAGDLFGHAIGLYDSDGDGCSEIAVGIPGENNSAGYIQILPGSRSGIDTAADYLVSQGSTGIPGARESGDQFGYSLTATNLTDGTPVVAIGVPGEDIQTDTSGAYRDGDTRVAEVTDGGAMIYIQGDVRAWVDQNTPGVGGGVEESDRFGWDVAATPTHLIVGVPFEHTVDNTLSDAGAAFVFSHDTSPEGWPDYLTLLDQSDTYLNGAPESGDRLGYNVAAVDYLETGRGPNQVETLFAISAPWEDMDDSSILNTGVVMVVKRDSSGVYSEAGYYKQQGAWLGDESENYDHLGTSLALMNLDPTHPATNSTLQLVIGALDENYATGDDDGLVHITGAAAPATAIDTMLTYPDPVGNGRFGTGLGFTDDRLYLTAPGTGGLYAFDWAESSAGTTQTAGAVPLS